MPRFKAMLKVSRAASSSWAKDASSLAVAWATRLIALVRSALGDLEFVALAVVRSLMHAAHGSPPGMGSGNAMH